MNIPNKNRIPQKLGDNEWVDEQMVCEDVSPREKESWKASEKSSKCFESYASFLNYFDLMENDLLLQCY